MTDLLVSVNSFLWGIPTLIMILGVGIYLSIKTRFIQIRRLPFAIKRFFEQFKIRNRNGISGFQALSLALAATVGTGNLAGVAGAIAIGGPGAIFWMWLCALFGMVTKYAEAVLAVSYRTRIEKDMYLSGPMYMIRDGLPRQFRFLAYAYCFFGVVASFGVGNATQVNAVVCSLESALSAFDLEFSFAFKMLAAGMISLSVIFLLSGGTKRLGKVTQIIVPLAALCYLLLGVFVLIVRRNAIPTAFAAIIKGAFMPQAVTGGVVGSAFVALRTGASRGVFTNEAGMGTASIAHGTANVDHPAEQGLMGIMEVFIDTILICTLTGLVILCSGVPISYGIDTGVSLTTQAFTSVCGNWITVPIALIICVLAFATILGWSLYGIRCSEFLFGNKVQRIFILIQGFISILGVCLNTGTVWILSEIVNALMAMPNLIALIYLTPEVVKLTESYFKYKKDCLRGGNPISE